MRLHLNPPSRSTRRALVMLLVLALLWAQSLGLWHGVVHDRHAQNSQAIAQPEHATGHPTGHGTWERLFSSHEDAADCLFFDQLSHGDAIASLPMLVLPLASLPVVLQYSHALFIARWHAQFQARGPPFFR
jgi:hypothetical protein